MSPASPAGSGPGSPRSPAGPRVRRNESINFDGRLPNVPLLESKLWLGAQLPYGFQGGTFTTFSSGEYVTPTFEITPRFRYVGYDLRELRFGEFDGTMGQTIFLEPRGNRKYGARAAARVEGYFLGVS